MMTNYDEAFERLIGHEGGWVNNPRDPGGETKYGISKRSYPRVDIKNLTLDDAKAIYHRDYWLAAGCDKLAPPLNYFVFDFAVNAGVRRAIILLQKAVKVEADGLMGPATLKAVAQTDNVRLLCARYEAHVIDFRNDLPTWPTFGRGWSQRSAENLLML
jgi:lysozyme family protein